MAVLSIAVRWRHDVGVLAMVIGSCALSTLSTRAGAQVLSSRVDQISVMLPQAPTGVGVPCSNRAVWAPLLERFSGEVQEAMAGLAKPIPAWDDNAYLEFSRNGNRVDGERMLESRQDLLGPLVVAECVEGQGRFIPRLTELIDSLSTQKSWAYAGNDPNLTVYRGKLYFVELNSAAVADMIAESLFLLGTSLPEATRVRAMNALEQRVFVPMRQAYATGNGESWLTVESNWNAVCLNGVTGAALAVMGDRHDRALFVAGAERYYPYYLKSYSADGYDVEGIGYWNYGLTSFAELRERIWQSTNGRIEIFKDPLTKKIASFGIQFQMLPGVTADFGDAAFNAHPNPQLVAYIEDVFGIVDPQTGRPVVDLSSLPPVHTLISDVMTSFPIHSQLNKATQMNDDSMLVGLRTYYPDSKVLVERPATTGRFAITFKAGGNASHSHNDIGAYSIGEGGTQPLGDPGGPAFYTAQSFSAERYQSPLFNSYGHPVPVIGGQLQKDATTVNVPVLQTSFTPEQDFIVVDMTEAYNAPFLTRYERTMRFSRQGPGAVDIVDNFQLKSPTVIDEALPTHGTWSVLDARTLEVTVQGQRLDCLLYTSRCV